MFSSMIDGDSRVEYLVGIAVCSRPGDGPLCVFPDPAAARTYLEVCDAWGDVGYQRWWCRVTCSSDQQAWLRQGERYGLYTDVGDLGGFTLLADTVMLKAEVADDD